MLPPRASPQAKLGATNVTAFMFMTTQYDSKNKSVKSYLVGISAGGGLSLGADGAVFGEGVGQVLDVLPTLQGRKLRPPCCNLKHKVRSGASWLQCSSCECARCSFRSARYYAGGDGAARPIIPLNTYRGIAPNFRCPYWTLCGDWPNRVVEPEGVLKLFTVRF